MSESPIHNNVGGSLLWLISALLLPAGGCLVGPDFRPPDAPATGDWLPPQSTYSSTQPAATRPSIATTRPVDIIQWWTTFNDQTLDRLIGRAMESNLDLRQAESRIREARAARGIVSAGLWPDLDATGVYRRSRSGGDAGDRQRDLFRAGLDAAWEIDVFGGTRRDIEASEARIQAAVEDHRDVLVSLAAEVALNYMDLRSLQQRIVISEGNLKSQRRSAELTRQRFKGGFVSALDVANAESLVATTESEIPLLESAVRESMYALALLLARPPGALVAELSTETPIPTVPPEIPVGLPSELLRRRPDIRRAEAQVHIATARIGVATADLFPRFSLTGSLGLESDKLKSFGTLSNHFWTIGPSVSWPLFDAGRIRSNIQVQNESQEQALLQYDKTVLIALRDVEVALVAYAKEQEHRKSLAEAVASNRKAVDLSTRLYTQGQTDFLNVLQAQRSLLLTEDALVRSDRTLATNLVALYKALGGGWETISPASTRPSTRPASPSSVSPTAQ